MNKMRISTKWEKFSEDISSDFAEIKRIVKEYYEQLYSNKSDNLSEMDKFVGTYNLPRLKHKEIENLNTLITNKNIKSVTKTFQQKSSASDGFTGEFYQTCKELNQSFSNSSKN